MQQVCFCWFFPTKKSALEREISWQNTGMPVVYYETPRCLEKSFKMIMAKHPEVMVCVGRELTKCMKKLLQ